MDSDIVPDDKLPSHLQDSDVVPDDKLPAHLADSDVVPDDKLPDQFKTNDKYQTTGQQIGTAVEGGLKGLAGPFSPLVTGAEIGLSNMGVPGLSAEDQKGREQANPWIHGASEGAGLVGGMFAGTGELGIVERAAEALAPKIVPQIASKLGASVIKSAIGNMLFQGGDEVSKVMLGEGDPEAPIASAIAHIGAAGLLGGAAGGVFHGAASGLTALGDAKAGTAMKDFLSGVADAHSENTLKIKMSPEDIGIENEKAWGWGKKFYEDGLPKLVQTIPDKITSGVASGVAGKLGGLGGAISAYDMTHKVLGPYVDKIVGKPLAGMAQKAAYAVALKALPTGETGGIYQAIDHAADVGKGFQKMNQAVGNLFKAGSKQAVESYASDRDEEKIKEYLDKGGLNQQIQNEAPEYHAEGGAVGSQVNGVATHFPEQAMGLGLAKGRVSGYLSSLRPQKDTPKLPYDKAMPTHKQEKTFNRAVKIAAQPLTILNKVKNGSLTSEEMNHFHQLYPEMYSQLSKQITTKIMEQQMSGEKPNPRTLQGMSLFLGAPLTAALTPENIQAAQMVFVNQKQAAQAPQKTTKGTSKLGEIAKESQTAEQAAQSRQTSER